MSLLSRYVARAVISGSLLVLLVLGLIKALFSISREAGDTGQGDYAFADAALYVLLTLPAGVYELFPAAVAIGGVLGLGQLAANSELVVMRAAGVSTARIVRMVMLGGVVLMVVIVGIGELIAPPSQQYAERMRASALAGQSDTGMTGGLWVRDRDRFIHVGEILPGRVLRDVRVYRFDQRALRRSLYAEQALYERNADQWRLQGVRSTGLEGDALTTESVDERVWQRLVPPDLFDVLTVSPETLPSWRLYNYVDYLRANELDSARFALAFWQKIATPLTTLVMLLLAVPLVFGPVRAAGIGHRLFVGSMVGIGYLLLAELFSHIGIVYGLAAPIAVLTPVVAFGVLGTVMLRRAV